MACLLATVKSVQCGPKGDRRKMGTNDRPHGLPFSRMLSRHKLWANGGGRRICPTGCPPPLPSPPLRQSEWTLATPKTWTGGNRLSQARSRSQVTLAAFFCFDGGAGSCLMPVQVPSRAARGSPKAKSEVTSGPPCCALEACPPAAPSTDGPEEKKGSQAGSQQESKPHVSLCEPCSPLLGTQNSDGY